jgi:hypothetical protein
MTTYRYDRAARRRSQFLARTEWLKPDWPVVPDAKVAIVPGRSSGVRFSVIARVLKQYVELATGDKFNFDGCSRGGHD